MPYKDIYAQELERFETTKDRSSLRIRRLLDELQRAKPDMGSIKVVDYGEFGVKLMLSPQQGVRGCVAAWMTVDQIRAELDEAAVKFCGSFI